MARGTKRSRRHRRTRPSDTRASHPGRSRTRRARTSPGEPRRPTAPPHTAVVHSATGAPHAVRRRSPFRSALRSPGAVRCFAPTASWLLGITIGMFVVGLAATLVGPLSPFGISSRAMIGASFCALGAGVIVPHRFALWIASHAWNGLARSAGRRTESVNWLVADAAPDRPLYWSVLSVIALVAGLAMAVTPLVVRVTASGLQILWDHFVWSAAPLELLRVCAACAVGLVPLSLLGLSTSCVHHLSCPHGRWEPRATSWLLLGGATGILVASIVPRLGTISVLPLLAAALPALLLSITCAGFASLDRTPARAPDTEDAAVPAFSDRYPRLTRASVIAVGGGAACAVFVWSSALRGNDESDSRFLAGALAAMGLGAGLGGLAGNTFVRSIGGFGTACAVSGVMVAAAAGMTNTDSTGWIRTSSVFLSISAIGFAMAMGRTLMMHRVGSRVREGALMTGRLLFCVAIACWLTAPMALGIVGAPATLVMLALALLAIGGILVVHDPSATTIGRRVRLAFVFGAVGTMIALGSSPINPWHRTAAFRATTLETRLRTSESATQRHSSAVRIAGRAGIP